MNKLVKYYKTAFGLLFRLLQFQQTPERPDIFLSEAEDNFGKSKATEKVTSDLKGKSFLTLETHHCSNQEGH